MFQPNVIVAPEASFEETVAYPQPKGNGNYHTHRFKLRFAVLPTAESDKLIREILTLPEEEQDDPDALRARLVKLLGRIVIGWPEGELGDEKGKPMAYGEKALAELLQVPGMLQRILETYQRAMSGPAKSGRRRGN